MAIRVGINGFGRVGRQVFKALWERYRNKLEVVAINDRALPEMDAHLLKHDSTYGKFDVAIKKVGSDRLIIGGREVRAFVEKDEKEPTAPPWEELKVELVIESTGGFTDATKAKAHIDAGAKKVIITAPAENEDLTVVVGINHEEYDPRRHHIISTASCTTNSLAPVAKVLQEEFGIQKGLMTTVHAYTNDQRLLDLFHKDDFRRARSAALNIVPTRTGAAKAIHRVIPELEGKMHGIALRVPVPTVSITDLVVLTEKDVTRKDLLGAFRKWQRSWEDKGLKILRVEDEPLVSSDFIGEEYSTVIDAENVMVIGDNLVKVLAWYDNEWAYSLRVAEFAAYMAGRGI
jgi:glyceraldehyde 3-phosphate dehydrogenase